MLSHIGQFVCRIRRLFTRSRFYVRLMGMDVEPVREDEPGLIMIQIDGLAKPQFETALKNKRMPFLQSLLDRQNYKLYPHYPGVPSTTPAVQAELLYGVRQAVPAFNFYDPDRDRNAAMLDPVEAHKIETEISSDSEGVLRGGSAYCDIYSGGAKETHFCVSDLSAEGFFRHRYPLGFLLLILLNLFSLLRVGILIVFEFFLALTDAVRGVISGNDLLREITFIPSRVGTCIFLRELAVIGARIDIERNLPIIHINFLGYDEQSHRRGPSSLFAHWSLRGIDDAVKRIYRAANKSAGRHYDLWVYSDHGQEETKSYRREYGRSLKAAVGELLREKTQNSRADKTDRRDNIYPGYKRKKYSQNTSEKLNVSATGPVAHIYLPDGYSASDAKWVAMALVDNGIVPVTLLASDSATAGAFYKFGQYRLPDDWQKFFPPDYPYAEQTARDLAGLCRHKYAGDIIALGWDPKEPYLSFPMENGSHGGPGIQETNAFAILPLDIQVDDRKGYLRPRDIYDAAMRFRKNCPITFTSMPRRTGPLRLMTYNVHSCRGLDGKLSPRRIARVIAQAQPDIVALQELDHGKKRSLEKKQIALVAKYLNMEYHFHPVMKAESEQYGDGILTRLPIENVKKYTLPRPRGMNWLEIRGAIEVTVKAGDNTVTVINTHIGLTAKEKKLQTDCLLHEILPGVDRESQLVLCGDFNFSGRSSFYKRIQRELSPCLGPGDGRSSLRTWPSRYPVTQLDHIFVDRRIRPVAVRTVRSDLAAVASDHFPLIADLEIPKPGCSSRNTARKAETKR